MKILFSPLLTSIFCLPVFLTFAVLSLVTCTNLHAQTFSEWFQQDKTQKKYLLAQIAALQTYISGVEKGYNIAKKGLTTISNITNGELGLHTIYFNSQSTVNPKIKNYSKVSGITQTEDAADAIRKKMINEASSSGMLSSQERSDLQSISNNIITDESKDLDELKFLITDGTLKMTDDERIKRIDQLYSSVRKKYNSVQLLATNIHMLVVSRQTEQKNATLLKQLYDGQ